MIERYSENLSPSYQKVYTVDMTSLARIVQLLLQYKYYFLFPVAIVEGPIVATISGFLISKGILNFFAAYGVLVIGDVVGDSICYAIGRFGGRPFIKRWGYIFGIDETRVAATEKHFANHAATTLFFGKTQPYGTVILAVAGISKMDYRKFLWINTLGTLIKSLIFITIGYYFGREYEKINKYINYVGITFIVGTILVLWYLWRNKKQG